MLVSMIYSMIYNYDKYSEIHSTRANQGQKGGGESRYLGEIVLMKITKILLQLHLPLNDYLHVIGVYFIVFSFSHSI